MKLLVSVFLVFFISFSSFSQWSSSPGQYGGNVSVNFTESVTHATHGNYAGVFSVNGTSEWNGLESYFTTGRFWRTYTNTTPMAFLLEGRMVSLSGADSLGLIVGFTVQTPAKRSVSFNEVARVRKLAWDRILKGERNFILNEQGLVYMSISEILPADSTWHTFVMDVPEEWRIGNVVNIDIDALSISDEPAAVSTRFLLDNLRFQYDLDGNTVIVESFGSDNITTDVPDAKMIPQEFALTQNYPNPFNPGTVIKFSSYKAERITLKVYNILGNEITALVDEVMPAGEHEVKFNASNLASGTYFYVLQAGQQRISKKMILLK
jgi:hypothetical protein